MPSETKLSGLPGCMRLGSSCARAGPQTPASAAESAVSLRMCLVRMVVSPLSAPETAGGRVVLRAVAAVDVGMAIQAAAADTAQKRVGGGSSRRQRAGLA